MSVARVTEIISGSKKSFEDAIEKGIARAVKTLKNGRVGQGAEGHREKRQDF
jgi:flavin-binding protein dodecin